MGRSSLAGMARDDGQASVEYLGLLGLVCALVLAGMGAPALARRDMPGAVVREVRRALCVVTGGVCDLDRRPCVVASREVQDSGGVDLVVVRLGSREVALREDRSDGSVAVTFLRDRSAGLDLAVGGGVHLRLGRRTIRLGAQAEATALATLGSGMTWVLPDGASADRLMRSLVVDGIGDLARRVADRGRPDARGAPAPSWTGSRRGLAVSLGASAGPGGLELGSADLAGVATERATGRRTYVVRRRSDVAAAAAAAYERRATRMGLVAARQRGPDGLWRARDDCVRA